MQHDSLTVLLFIRQSSLTALTVAEGVECSAGDRPQSCCARHIYVSTALHRQVVRATAGHVPRRSRCCSGLWPFEGCPAAERRALTLSIGCHLFCAAAARTSSYQHQPSAARCRHRPKYAFLQKTKNNQETNQINLTVWLQCQARSMS